MVLCEHDLMTVVVLSAKQLETNVLAALIVGVMVVGLLVVFKVVPRRGERYWRGVALCHRELVACFMLLLLRWFFRHGLVWGCDFVLAEEIIFLLFLYDLNYRSNSPLLKLAPYFHGSSLFNGGFHVVREEHKIDWGLAVLPCCGEQEHSPQMFQINGITYFALSHILKCV